MPTASADRMTLTREQLLEFAKGGDSYGILSMVLPVLSQLPDDNELRLDAFRHYISLGLIRPALEIAEEFPVEFRGLPQIQDELEKLTTVPSGQVPWSRLRTLFSDNARCLSERYPHLSLVESVWQKARAKLELYQCRDGNYQISVRDNAGQRIWLGRLADHKAEAERLDLPRDPNSLMPGSILFEGMHFGWYLDRVWRETANTFLHYSPAIYIVEPNLLELAAAMHVRDWRPLLQDPRVYLFAGDDWAEQYRKALLEQDTLPAPSYTIRSPRWSEPVSPSTDALAKEINQHRVTVYLGLLEDVNRAYAPCGPSHWAERYRTIDADDPLRVMFFVSRHTVYLQYCIRDLAASFEAKGARTRILMEEADHHKLSAITYLQVFREFRPDMVFIIDHHRSEYKNIVPENVPYVCWVQDLLPNLYCRQAGESLGPMDFYITSDFQTLVTRHAYPASQGLSWNTVTDHRLYSNERLPDEELAPYRCDFSYVSNQSRSPAEFLAERMVSLKADSTICRVMTLAYEDLLQSILLEPRSACGAIKEYLNRAMERVGISSLSQPVEDTLLTGFLYPLSELMFRQNALEWVADYCDRTGRTLHLYGNGWDRHPRFSKYARGFMENGRPLRALHQASKVNLQIIATGAMHQRLLDGLAAGGFFLLRYTPTDVIQEPAEHLIEVVDRMRPEDGREYRREEVPDLAAALERIWSLNGLRRLLDRFVWKDKFANRYRQQRDDGFMRAASSIFPHYNEVSFGTREEFEAAADRYLNDEAARERVASAMREVVVARYTFASMIDQLMERMRGRMRELASSASTQDGEE